MQKTKKNIGHSWVQFREIFRTVYFSLILNSFVSYCVYGAEVVTNGWHPRKRDTRVFPSCFWSRCFHQCNKELQYFFFECVVDFSAHIGSLCIPHSDDIYRLTKSCCSDTIMGEILSFCGFCTKSGFTVCLFSGLHGWQMCFWFLVLTCMIFTMRVMWQGSKWKWWICFLFSQ